MHLYTKPIRSIYKQQLKTFFKHSTYKQVYCSMVRFSNFNYPNNQTFFLHSNTVNLDHVMRGLMLIISEVFIMVPNQAVWYCRQCMRDATPTLADEEKL